MFETTPALAEMPILDFQHPHQGEGTLLAYADEEEETSGGWRKVCSPARPHISLWL